MLCYRIKSLDFLVRTYMSDALATKHDDVIIVSHSKTAMKQFRDRQVGHSYFWDIKDDNDLKFVIKYEVIPLLQDYFYNDYGLLRKVLGSKEHDGHDYNIIGKDNRPTDLVNKGKGSVKFKINGTTGTKDMTLRNYLLEEFD